VHKGPAEGKNPGCVRVPPPLSSGMVEPPSVATKAHVGQGTGTEYKTSNPSTSRSSDTTKIL